MYALLLLITSLTAASAFPRPELAQEKQYDKETRENMVTPVPGSKIYRESNLSETSVKTTKDAVNEEKLLKTDSYMIKETDSKTVEDKFPEVVSETDEEDKLLGSSVAENSKEEMFSESKSKYSEEKKFTRLGTKKNKEKMLSESQAIIADDNYESKKLSKELTVQIATESTIPPEFSNEIIDLPPECLKELERSYGVQISVEPENKGNKLTIVEKILEAMDFKMCEGQIVCMIIFKQVPDNIYFDDSKNRLVVNKP